MYPRYLNLLQTGELLQRINSAYKAMRSCKLCPRDCGVNRLRGNLGFCATGKILKVASFNSHLGEEPPISGTNGSGTIFFSSCNMRCMFCQNYPISQLGHGATAAPGRLAQMMLELQRAGCHNINLVTPSHVVPQLLAGLYIAASKGLDIPIVYNTSGYDGLESLKLLDGIVDIYMPDIKYADDKNAKEYSGAKNYWAAATAAVKEMHRQVGGLEINPEGVAVKGLIIRHLVLPENISGTDRVLEFIAREISPKTYVSLMSQFFPAHAALNDPMMHKRVSKKEFAQAVKKFHHLGMENGWIQKR